MRGKGWGRPPLNLPLPLKPGFHMSGKSQTIRYVNFCRPSQIHRIIARSLSQILERSHVYLWEGAGAKQFRGLVMSEIHRRRSRRYKFEFSFVGNDRRPSQKSVTHRENRTLPILQICPRPSLTNGNILDFEFSLVGKIWDGLETVKCPIVWDFLDIWKPGLECIMNSVLVSWEETHEASSTGINFHYTLSLSLI